MKITGIYQITSPSGKIYIGQSSDILERWKKYQRLIKNNQRKLENSLHKYGVSNHKFEILTECTLPELDKLEILYKKFIVSKMGWSKTLFCELYDGNQRGPRSEETKRKISESNKGKEVWITGKKHTDKAKAKISKANKGRKNPKARNLHKGNTYRRKPVLQYTTNGEFIKEWESAQSVKYSGFTNIVKHLNGGAKTCKGYIFKYKEI